MKNNIDISSIARSFSSFIRRFHTLLFFLLVSGGLFAAIAILLSVISLSSTKATSSSQTVNGTFDNATIERLKQGTGETIKPERRASPFIE